MVATGALLLATVVGGGPTATWGCCFGGGCVGIWGSAPLLLLLLSLLLGPWGTALLLVSKPPFDLALFSLGVADVFKCVGWVDAKNAVRASHDFNGGCVLEGGDVGEVALLGVGGLAVLVADSTDAGGTISGDESSLTVRTWDGGACNTGPVCTTALASPCTTAAGASC